MSSELIGALEHLASTVALFRGHRCQIWGAIRSLGPALQAAPKAIEILSPPESVVHMVARDLFVLINARPDGAFRMLRRGLIRREPKRSVDPQRLTMYVLLARSSLSLKLPLALAREAPHTWSLMTDSRQARRCFLAMVKESGENDVD